MNKKAHIFGLIMILLFIMYLLRNEIKSIFLNRVVEPFGNQIIFHGNGSLDPSKTTYSVLTYDNDLYSGYTQASICSDDNSWTKGDKTCRDYSVVGSKCDDVGSDGRSALVACKVACDNCSKYTEVTRRSPSPIEDTEEPSYMRFEGGEGSSDSGGSVDFREMINRLDDIDNKMDILSGAGAPEDAPDTDTVDPNWPLTMDWDEDADLNGSHPTINLTHVSPGENFLWGVDSDGTLHYKPIAGGQWRGRVGVGTSEQIDEGGGVMYATNDAHQPLRISEADAMNGTGVWERISNLDNIKHISANDTNVWFLIDNPTTYDFAIMRDGGAFTALPQLGAPSLTRMTRATMMSVGQNFVWMVDSAGGVYKTAVDGTEQWTAVDGSLEWVSAADNNWVWGTNSDNHVFKCRKPCDPANPEWITVGTVALDHIDGSPYGNEVWGTREGVVYRKE